MSTNYGFEPTLSGLNDIDSDSTTTTNIVCDTIKINTSGTAPTMTPGDNTTNIATTAFVNGALTTAFVTLNTTQTITGEKTLSNANTFITGNTVTNSIQSSAVGTTQNIATTQTSGILNVGTLGARSGAININTGGTTTAGVNISTASTSFNTVSIGSASSAVTMGGATTFTNTTPSSFTFGVISGKVNPSAVGGLLTIGDTQTTGILGIGGLPARSGRIDINVGGTSTAPVNISSGTNANAPITIGSTASTTQTTTHNAISTFSKNATFQGNVYLNGTGLIESTTNDMQIKVASANTLTFVCGSISTLSVGVGSNLFQGNCRVAAPAILQLEGTSTGYRMYYIEFDKYAYFTGYGSEYLGMKFLNTSGTQQLEITDTAITATTALTLNGTATFNNNVLIQQSTYPPTNSSAIGYTVTATSAEFTFTANTLGNVQSFTLPSKGVYLVITNLSQRTTGGAGSVNNRRFLIATTNTSNTAVGTALYFEEGDDSVGANTIRMVETIQTVISVTASTTYYVNGTFGITGVTVLATATTSYTRIG